MDIAEDNVNSQIVNDSINTNILSKREKKLTVVAIIVFSLLIVILLALIAEAYINQHPVLEFLQYGIFNKSFMIIGSISISLLFLGILFLGVLLGLLILNNFKSTRIALSLIIMQLASFFLSLIFFSYSYNWSLGWKKYICLVFISSGSTLGLYRIIIFSQFYRKLLNIISLVLCMSGIIFLLSS